jgi:hypothetical protein
VVEGGEICRGSQNDFEPIQITDAERHNAKYVEVNVAGLSRKIPVKN